MFKTQAIKRTFSFLSWLVILFLVLNTAALVVKSDRVGLDAAYAKCAQQGWSKADLELQQQKWTSGMLGQTAEFTFKSRDSARRKTIHVLVRRPLYVKGWRVTDYSETTDPTTRRIEP